MNSNNNNNKPDSGQNKPQTYTQIKKLGEGSFGKAYLVECTADKVSIYPFTHLVTMCYKNYKY
jgi:hypothetical protein